MIRDGRALSVDADVDWSMSVVRFRCWGLWGSFCSKVQEPKASRLSPERKDKRQSISNQSISNSIEESRPPRCLSTPLADHLDLVAFGRSADFLVACRTRCVPLRSVAFRSVPLRSVASQSLWLLYRRSVVEFAVGGCVLCWGLKPPVAGCGCV